MRRGTDGSMLICEHKMTFLKLFQGFCCRLLPQDEKSLVISHEKCYNQKAIFCLRTRRYIYKLRKRGQSKRRLMKKENSSTLLSNAEGYMSISLWELHDDESTYYDRRLDLQGEVPGCSLEEAKKAFEEKYGIKL